MNINRDIRMPDFCNRRFPFHYMTALHILKKRGIDLSGVELLAVGEYENYKGEIKSQKPSPGTLINPDIRVVLEIGCSSAVDMIPYQFFYGLRGLTSRSGDWETPARKLMAPFDAAIIRREAEAAYQNLRYNLGFIDTDHIFRVLRLYNFQDINIKDIREALLWISVMPTFHYWAGNPELVAQVLGHLFQYEFQIIENIPTKYDLPENLQYHLGSKPGALGREMILGRTFTELDSGYEVVIRNVNPDDVVGLLPGHSRRKKLESILGFCMPNNLNFRIRVKVKKENTTLGRQQRKGYLGYSTYI